MKISIVTACYNSKATIRDTLNSIQMQTHQDIEHIVVDGGSTDGTLEILEANKKQIACLISEPDKGLYDAMNKGIRKASGDVIGILNSDDLFANENALNNISIALSNPKVDACYGDLVYVKQEDINTVVRHWESCPYKPELFSKGWIPAHPTFYVRKAVHDKIGLLFDADYKLAADYELLLRLLYVHKINVTHIPEIIIKMRIGGVTNKSFQNIWNQNKEIMIALKKHQYPYSALTFVLNKILDRIQQYNKARDYIK